MEIGKKTKLGIVTSVCVLLLGFILPEGLVIPVQGSSDQDWNHKTFWHEPWGRSGVHKGIDIFSPVGRPVVSATYGVVVFKGNLELGGKVIIVLGPKWRIHYYAHLDRFNVSVGSLVGSSEMIGSVGNSGNAKGKPPHLHYSILTLLPYIWRWDTSTQGWKKIFFLNPSDKLLGG